MTTPSKTLPKPRGRPRLTAEAVQARVAAYCSRYGVSPNAEGLPPFPTGRRETKQHHEWMSVYRAYKRLSDAGPAGGRQASQEELAALLEAQNDHCLICGATLDLAHAVLDARADARAALHKRCREYVGLAFTLGPDSLEHVRNYLWAPGAGKPRRG